MRTYPDYPGSYTTDTSVAAADAAAGQAESLRQRCREVLHNNPMTSDEVASALGESVLSIRPRLTELKKRGEVEDTGHRRTNASGRMAAVFRLAVAPLPLRGHQQELFA